MESNAKTPFDEEVTNPSLPAQGPAGQRVYFNYRRMALVQDPRTKEWVWWTQTGDPQRGWGNSQTPEPAILHGVTTHAVIRPLRDPEGKLVDPGKNKKGDPIPVRYGLYHFNGPAVRPGELPEFPESKACVLEGHGMFVDKEVMTHSTGEVRKIRQINGVLSHGYIFWDLNPSRETDETGHPKSWGLRVNFTFRPPTPGQIRPDTAQPAEEIIEGVGEEIAF